MSGLDAPIRPRPPSSGPPPKRVEEEDPLDTFMSGIKKQVSKAPAAKPAPAAVADEEVDPLDAFMSGNAKQIAAAADEEVDPLDAFMSGNAEQIASSTEPAKASRCDEEDDDDTMMSYLNARKERAKKALMAGQAHASGSRLGGKFQLKSTNDGGGAGNDSDEEVLLVSA